MRSVHLRTVEHNSLDQLEQLLGLCILYEYMPEARHVESVSLVLVRI